MNVERAVRLMAGVLVLVSVALTYYVSQYWMWFTVFIGLNLLQSAFTNWCPAISIFRAIGLKDASCSVDRVEQFRS
jgi:glucan phosphoethanolaminetransferase (alkaline phosphatase superfamily)